MKLGIMQPYFFPYIGYWQLMNAVDTYVIYDDVNFIKGGWINRNRILIGDKINYFNLPMIGSSPFKLINEIEVNNDQRAIDKNLRMIEGAYKKAPYYNEVYGIIESTLNCNKKYVSEYIEQSFKLICDYLDIKTKLVLSSAMDKDCSLKGKDKVIHICKILGATEYYNAIGGMELYQFDEFKQNGIKLSFLETDPMEYQRFDKRVGADLSIIDVMMFNSKDNVKNMLSQFQLVQE